VAGYVRLPNLPSGILSGKALERDFKDEGSVITESIVNHNMVAPPRCESSITGTTKCRKPTASLNSDGCASFQVIPRWDEPLALLEKAAVSLTSSCEMLDPTTLAALGHAQRTGTPTHCLLQQCPSSLSGKLAWAHPSSDRFLALHHHLDREEEAVKSMCSGVSKQVVLLEGLDCLIPIHPILQSHYPVLEQPGKDSQTGKNFVDIASPQTGI